MGLIGSAFPVYGINWEPIDPAHLAQEKPKIDPEADAEAIFWHVWVADEMQGSMAQTIKQHYVRVKIFTERGVEDQSTIDLASVSKMRIHDLRGRTIKPDGTVVELEKADVFERDVLKTGGLRVRRRSFSMPNVEVGDIIEYQWREFFDNSYANNLRLYFDREMPVWKVTYHVKPSSLAGRLGYTMRSQPFNLPGYTGWTEGVLRYYESSAENVPAFKSEGYMPPEDQERSWILLFYAKDKQTDPDKFWKTVSRESYAANSGGLKPNGAVKSKAAELIAGAQSDDEKLARLRDFCLNEIRSLYHDRSGVSGEERGDFKENKGPGDTLKSGIGTSADIDLLFGALANAAGFDARVALVPQRDDVFFNPNYLSEDLLTSYLIAVDVAGEWRFYKPSLPYVPSGMLSWPNEGVAALVTDSKELVWVQTPFSMPDSTLTKRVAELELLDDGTLEGTVTKTFSGQRGINNKRVYDGLTEEERVERVEELVTSRLSEAEVSDIEIHNADSPEGDFGYSYKVRVPGYAASTGTRLFLPPSYFQRNIGPRFTTSERQHDIYFSYAWTEIDEVTIKLPEGYDLESPDAPEGTRVPEIGAYQVELAVSDDNALNYTRRFVWGEGGNILFPAAAYPAMKQVFDKVHEADDHMITLRKVDAGAATGGR